MFKNLYRQEDYTIVEAPYRLRGAFLPKKNRLDAVLKEKEKDEEEQIRDLASEIKKLQDEIKNKKSEIEALQQQYISLTGKAEEEAKRIIDAAKNEAENIKNLKSKLGYEEGFDKGYYEGIEKGKAEILGKYASLMATLNDIVKSAQTEKNRVISESENEMVDLALEIAKKIVNSEISMNKNLVINFVKEAIKRLEDKEKVIVFAHPEDIDIIKMYRSEFAELTDAENAIHIIPDDMLNRGECRLESNTEIIDTDINQQFGVLAKKLKSGE